MANPHETNGRQQKAERIVALFRKMGGTAQDALELTDEHWGYAAQLAGVKVPSIETRVLIWRMLGES